MSALIGIVVLVLIVLALVAAVVFHYRRPAHIVIVPAREDTTAQTLGRLDLVVDKLENITAKLEARERDVEAEEEDHG